MNDTRIALCGLTFIFGFVLIFGNIISLKHIKERNLSGVGIITNKFLKDESDGFVTILFVSINHNGKIYNARILESSVNFNSYNLGQKINLIFNIDIKNNDEIQASLEPTKNIEIIYYFCIFIGILLILIFIKNFLILLKENRNWFS